MGDSGASLAGRTAGVDDACLALGQFAAVLVDPAATSGALDTLVRRLGLGTTVLRDPVGTVLARVDAAGGPTVELPVHGRSGALIATLTVAGAAPAHLPVLRTAAAVLGLALAQQPLHDVLEDDRTALAEALHDGPVQSLVVARYASDAAVRGGDPVAARDAVQAALVDVRRFLWSLRPRGGSGFVEALDQLSSYVVEAGGPALGLVGDVDAAGALRGAAGVTAYRLVQAVAKPDAPPVRVTLRNERARLLVDVEGGAPLATADRWQRRARALGGELTTSAGRLRLALPHPEARTAL